MIHNVITIIEAVLSIVASVSAMFAAHKANQAYHMVRRFGSTKHE